MRRGLRPTLAALAAAVAAGCGGVSAPTLSSDVALPLARQSDQVVRALRKGDRCAAAQSAEALRAQADAAIAKGLVPRALASELRRRTARLASSIVCLPPPPPPPPAQPPPQPQKGEKEHGKGHGHEKDKGKHKGKGED